MTKSTLKRSRSNSRKGRSKTRGKSKSRGRSKTRGKSKSRGRSKSREESIKVGGATKKSYNIITKDKRSIPLVCNVCKHDIFNSKKGKLSTNIKKTFFFNGIFDRNTRVFVCMNCSKVHIFSNKQSVVAAR